MALARTPFDLEVTCRNGTPLLAPAGELDLSTAPQLRAKVDFLVGKGHTALIVDAAGLSFVDSTGVSALLAAAQQAAVTIENPSLGLRHRLRQLGLSETFGLAEASEA